MSSSTRRPPRVGLWAAGAALAITLAGLAYRALAPSAETLYLRARSVLASDPIQAEMLLIESVQRAGGDFPQAEALWSLALGRQGRWMEALGCFSLIDHPQDCDVETLLQLADEALAAEVPLLVRQALEAGNRPGPRQADVLRRLALLEFQELRYDDALRHCRSLAELAPDDAFPWSLSGQILRRQRRLASAADALRTAATRRAAPEEALAVKRSLAELLLDLGELGEARAVVNQLLDQPQPSAADRVKHAYLLRLEGRPEEARRAADAVLAEAPQHPGALLVRGIAALDAGDAAAAVADLQLLVQSEPRNKEAHYKLAQAYRRSGRTEAASRHLEESQRLTQLGLKITELERQLAARPDDADARARLLRLYEQAGPTDAAALLRQHSREE